VPPPPSTVTKIFPLVAPEGQVAVIWLAVAAEIMAGCPLNVTLLLDKTALKFAPEITTTVPAGPFVGEKPVTVAVTFAVTISFLQAPKKHRLVKIIARMPFIKEGGRSGITEFMV